MRFLFRQRHTGKTAELIEESAKTGCYMVVRDRKAACDVEQRALFAKQRIPSPITYDEFLYGCLGSGVKCVLIDDADALLQHIAKGVEIRTLTFITGER